MPLMSMREYARHRGTQLSAVQYAVKVGRIHLVLTPDGKKKVDSDTADVAWELNTDPSKRNRGEFRRKVEAGETPDISTNAPRKPNMADAVLAEKIARAELSRLELREKQGKLVDAEAVKAEAFRLGRQVRDNMMNIPSRVIARLRAAEDEHAAFLILEEEIRKACEGLPNG